MSQVINKTENSNISYTQILFRFTSTIPKENFMGDY